MVRSYYQQNQVVQIRSFLNLKSQIVFLGHLKYVVAQTEKCEKKEAKVSTWDVVSNQERMS